MRAKVGLDLDSLLTKIEGREKAKLEEEGGRACLKTAEVGVTHSTDGGAV